MRAFRRLLLLTLFAAAGVALALGVGLSSRPPEPNVAEAASDPAAGHEVCTAQGCRLPATDHEPRNLKDSQPTDSSESRSTGDAGKAAAATAPSVLTADRQTTVKPNHGEPGRSDRPSEDKTADSGVTEEPTAKSPNPASNPSATEALSQYPSTESTSTHSANTGPIQLSLAPSAAGEAAIPHRTPANSSDNAGQLADPYPRLARLLKSGSSNTSTAEPSGPAKPAARATLPEPATLPAAGVSQTPAVGSVPAEPVPAPPGVRWPTAVPTPLPPVGAAVQSANGNPVPTPPAAGLSSPSAEGDPAVGGRAKGSVARVTTGEGDNALSIHIQNADIREVLELLSEKGNLNILAGNAVQGKVSATLRGVDIDSALKAILRSTGLVSRREGKFIYVGTPQEFIQIEQSLDQVGTRVYRPNYVTADELKTLITPLLTATTGTASVSTPAEKGISSTTDAAGNGPAGGDTLLVRDYEAVLAQVDQVVAEVDVRPLQVSIEAMILSVKLSDGNTFGVNFQLLHGDHMKFGWGTIPNQSSAVKLSDKVTVSSSDTALDGLTSVLLNGGLKFGYLDSNVGLYINALESVGDTNVIATPRVTVLNKQRAYVHIGEKLGYISTTVTETASTSSVEFLDVGTELRLRPFISRDGLIRMEVHPELSTGSVDKEENYTIPNKEVTEVTTNVMIRDGCTAVIGGLIRNQLSTTATQVPVLGSLPFLGVLFRGTSETTERHEIIVLITPRIIYDPETAREGDKEACEYHRRQAVYAEKMNPFSKRWIARRYFRLAQSAWAEGDRDRALRFAELAVHFDPLNRAAIDLRSDIWLNKPVGDHTSPCPADAAAGVPLDGQAVAPWLLSDLEHEPSPKAAVQPHPLDPGQPGTRVEIKRPRVLQP